ncbi:hypothetical protein AB4Y44_30630 [Paraburkholderia sp. BR10937]|uniref:hypothetical protein n=1 Tax=Paraburkholderia sp. BR10937 TaxID=3236994 RepID=UPI0034D3140C
MLIGHAAAANAGPAIVISFAIGLQRPVELVSSLEICALLYILMSWVLTGIVPYDQLNVADPNAVGVNRIGLKWLSTHNQARSDAWTDFRYLGAVAQPVSHLLLDGQGWPVASRCLTDSRALSHAVGLYEGPLTP